MPTCSLCGYCGEFRRVEGGGLRIVNVSVEYQYLKHQLWRMPVFGFETCIRADGRGVGYQPTATVG